MKFISAATLTLTVLTFESLLIQSKAAPIQRLYSEMAYASCGVCESIEDKNDCESTDLYDPLRACHWESIKGKCVLAEDEDICERITESEDTCNESSGCAWVKPENYGRPGEGHCVLYRIVSEGNCVYDYEDRLYIVESKDKCNDIKGCSWNKVNGGRKSCRVALSQLVCNDFENKKACKKNGCDWKAKAGECGGRWERHFLDFLVGKELKAAQTAIRVEYGEAYTVHIKAPETHVSKRITLVLDEEGVIVEAPMFG